MISKKENNNYKEVLVGKEVKITSNNKVIQGTVSLETKNTLKIDTALGIKTLIKNNCEIIVDNKKIIGKKIIKRIEDRIKTRWKKHGKRKHRRWS